MEKFSDIEKAIAAHAHWSTRLRQLVVDAQSAVDLASIRDHTQCDFGKWLHTSPWLREEAANESFLVVKSLHAQFHELAARVVELSMSGRIVEAYTLLYGEYLTMSGRLAIALRAWQAELLKPVLSDADEPDQ